MYHLRRGFSTVAATKSRFFDEAFLLHRKDARGEDKISRGLRET